VDALILAGGLGIRLRSVVSDRAKPVADVGDQPFVLWMMRHLARSGRISRFIVCSGHLAHTVRSALGDCVGRVPVQFSEEPEPLGTGGALRLAVKAFRVKGPAVAINGDSYLGIDFNRMLKAFEPPKTDCMLALAHVDSTRRYGRVEAEQGRVMQFCEKGIEGPGWVNAGLYLLSPSGCSRLAASPEKFSIEQDLFPASLAAKELSAYASRARFIDIGVPGDYELAQRMFRRRVR
jgi:D-glycero-alpha-D-manno-heptose 1-phosphate guanylyltransferase